MATSDAVGNAKGYGHDQQRTKYHHEHDRGAGDDNHNLIAIRRKHNSGAVGPEQYVIALGRE